MPLLTLLTNFIFHEELVKDLCKILDKKGIINIGGKSQSVYNFAKSKNNIIEENIGKK